MPLRIRPLHLLAATVLCAAPLGCGDDFTPADTDSASASGTDSASTGSTGGTATAGTDTATTAGTDTATGSTGTGTTGTGSGTDTATTGAGYSGVAAVEWVNAGGIGESRNYRLVWSFGQQTQNQNTMTSPGYRLQGGIIGAAE